MRRTILILAFFAVTQVGASERPVTPEDARTIFARFKTFAGTWNARSTKGWTETNTYEVAGKGSVVINRSNFDGEPNDGMLTTIFLDGDRLLLTHYCEAGNQPTLMAASIDDADQRVTFRFVSATNLEAHPGHMHSVVFQFIDANHVRSRWSFFSKGEERWFEDVDQVRAKK